MAGRHTKLTPELQEQVLTFIRAGGWDYIAAEAAGIDRSTFYRWLQRGRNASKGPYRGFFAAVREAKAQARLGAEVEVKKTKPELWLAKGPGRDREGAPGWTDRIEVAGDPKLPLRVTFDVARASGYPDLPLNHAKQSDDGSPEDPE